MKSARPRWKPWILAAILLPALGRGAGTSPASVPKPTALGGSSGVLPEFCKPSERDCLRALSVEMSLENARVKKGQPVLFSYKLRNTSSNLTAEYDWYSVDHVTIGLSVVREDTGEALRDITDALPRTPGFRKHQFLSAGEVYEQSFRIDRGQEFGAIGFDLSRPGRYRLTGGQFFAVTHAPQGKMVRPVSIEAKPLILEVVD